MFSLFVLRMVAWSYPLLHAWLWWQDSVKLSIYLGCFVVAMILSSITPLQFRGWVERLLWAVLLILPPFFLRLLVGLTEALFFSDQPTLLALFDFSFIPGMAMMVPFFMSNYLARLFRGYISLEWMVRLLLFIASSWATAGYRLFFYSHYDRLILLLALYFMVEVSIMILSSHRLREKSSFILTMLLFVLPSLTILPIIFGKISGQMVKYSGGLLEPTLSSFDFSKSLPLESEIDLGSDLILLLKVDPPLDSKQLFKRYTLAGYSDHEGFYQLDGYGDIDYLPPSPVIIDHGQRVGRKPLEQEVYLVNLEKKALIAAQQVEQIIPYQRWNESSFKGVYKVYSMINEASSSLLEAATSNGLTPDERDIYLKRGTLLPAVEALAEQLTAGLTSPYQKAAAINSFLRYNYNYSLRPGKATTGSQIEYFLFEGRKGYCSYFAYSMALMLRYLQIPARVATGFWADPTIEQWGYYPIQSNLAHAWVEVYFDDYGWVNFDPTSDLLDPYELHSGSGSDPLLDTRSLVDEINSNRLLMIPTAESLLPLPQASPPSVNPPVQRAAIKVMVTMLLLSVLLFTGYLIAIFRIRRQLKSNPADRESERVIKMCHELYFFSALSNKNLPFTLFLARHEKIAVLYRRALYSNHFSHNDFISFDECYHQVMDNNDRSGNRVTRLGLILSPRQFFIKASADE